MCATREPCGPARTWLGLGLELRGLGLGLGLGFGLGLGLGFGFGFGLGLGSRAHLPRDPLHLDLRSLALYGQQLRTADAIDVGLA